MSRPTALITRALRVTRMALHVAHGLVTVALIFPRATQERRDRLLRAWGHRLLGNFGVVQRVDKPPGFDVQAGRRLYVGNHISWLDIYALQAITAARFVAKAEIAAWPVLGRLIRLAGTVFIERRKRSDTRRINQTIVAHLRAGEAIAVFPEGTTSDGRDVIKFHGNLLQAAIDAEAEIVPFCLRYLDERGHYSDAAAFIGEMTMRDSVLRVLRERRLVCELTFFAPLKVDGRSRRELARVVESMVRERLRGHSRQDR